MNRPINFYIGALVITVVGSLATYLIVQVNFSANAYEYQGAGVTSSAERPSLKDEID